jgi:transposase
MQHPSFTLGVDIAKATFDVVLLGGKKPRPKHFKNTPEGFARLAEWLERWGVDRLHACMEATGGYERALARFLFEAGHVVSIVNPQRIAGQAQSELKRAKTDAVDAGLIARFCLEKRPEPWTPPAPEVETLVALARRLEDLIAMRVAETNRLEHAAEGGQTSASIRAHVAFLGEQIADIEREIEDHIDTHPDLKRDRELLDSLPGIGSKTATVLLCMALGRFDAGRKAVAFVGLAPKPHQSGSSVRAKTKLSKIGDARVRSALYWPAISAINSSEVFAAFYDRLLQRGKPKMVALVAVMRKLLTVAYGVLKSGEPFDPARAAARA